ncbi:MAG: hypothetical protein EHM28_00525 [Spirochaetaceae bacterium]|nr:MAG: hypothetical protein EHM28_00525 [Spirochaetaceae bacterium]
MKNMLLFGSLAFMGMLSICCQATGTEPAADPADFSVTLSFSEAVSNSGLVYAAWIEDEAGNNIQNLYVCNRILDIQYVAGKAVVGGGPGLMGDGIPNWLQNKYRDDYDKNQNNMDIDGVTGASVQGNIVIYRDLKTNVRRFKICIDIDRGNNGNEYFYWDRPAFSYSTGVINLDNLQPSYDLVLTGWTSNENGEGDPYTQYSQQPVRSDKTIPDITGYEIFKFMDNLAYIAPTDDMVNDLRVVVLKN